MISFLLLADANCNFLLPPLVECNGMTPCWQITGTPTCQGFTLCYYALMEDVILTILVGSPT